MRINGISKGQTIFVTQAEKALLDEIREKLGIVIRTFDGYGEIKIQVIKSEVTKISIDAGTKIKIDFSK